MLALKRVYAESRRRLRFYRHHTPYELMHARVYFSTCGEDVFLLEYFQGRQNGFYVDVGAYHPVAYSNTYAFYRSGWRGILVEPNPAKHKLLRRYRSRDILIPVAISAEDGTAEFADNESCSGIVDPAYYHQLSLASGILRVPTRPLRSILEENVEWGRTIDILSVDCEGHDEVVLESNDWERFRPLVVLCEAFGQAGAERLEIATTSRDYRRIGICGPTLVFEDTRDRSDRPPSYHAAAVEE